MTPVILRANPSPDDDEWVFNTHLPPIRQRDRVIGKHISFTPEAIKLDISQFPNNRILRSDDPSKFILTSFQALRFPDKPPSVAREYMMRFFKAGIFLNGIQYRFYGHSNSQLFPTGAKRIGLLFSQAELDWILDPRYTKDIDDIVFNGENFSDGCGLMSKRYRGYKGVLMLYPELIEEHLVHFRASQKKFTATQDDTFSVVDHSAPYAFARLNNDVIVLLASLGISPDTFLTKQHAYHEWIRAASDDWEVAFNFLCALGQFDHAERVLLDGLDSPRVQKVIQSCQDKELASFKKNEKFRARMVILKSRLLFGICDPYGVLNEGEVHVRVSVPRRGASALTNVDVLVVRNPCLHPGDCLKLRAVCHPRLAHLVDCIVFATKGKRAAPSMSSGGDLDGDRFMVIWDSDLVPKKVAEEYAATVITRQDLAKHFASYNSMSLAKIVSLHSKWLRYSPKGAMSNECQDLNALHSMVVDGGSVKIPERLLSPPTTEEPYVIDLLQEQAKEFFDNFTRLRAEISMVTDLVPTDARDFLKRFLSMEKSALSEYELITMATRYARKHQLDFKEFLSYIDFGALSTAEKYALSVQHDLSEERHPYIWNSLARSEILKARDLEDRNIGGPLRLQRLYTSSEQGRAAFFEYLKEATQYYNRRIMILKASGLMSTYWRGTKGYRLHCSDNVMQLYDQKRANTFIFVTRPPEKSGADIVTSIALQKISARVQKQCGRINRTPVVAIEIHVVSNRDRIAHQAFDLRFEHVQTEEFLGRFDHKPEAYTPNTLSGYPWAEQNPKSLFFKTGSKEEAESIIANTSQNDRLDYFKFALQHHAEERIFWIFTAVIRGQDLPLDDIQFYIEEYPPLAYSILKRFLPDESTSLPEAIASLSWIIIRNVIRSANDLGIASLVALEKLTANINQLNLPTFFDALWLVSLSVRASSLVQEVLLVLHECRAGIRALSRRLEYAHQHALAIIFDRVEEAADTCPCDESGRPRRQSKAPIRAKLVPYSSKKQELPQPNPGAEPAIGAPGQGQAHVEPRVENTVQTPGEEQAGPDAKGKIAVVAHIRVDAQTTSRIHSHVRLRVSSPPQGPHVPSAIVDAIVTRANRGELYLEVQQPLPPEYDRVDWNLYDAGSTATSKAMLDAVLRLAEDGYECCRFNDVIIGTAAVVEEDEQLSQDLTDVGHRLPETLNASQCTAVLSAQPGSLSLIWGPPGKTTVVVQILLRFLREDPECRILMTASTHNAVDNVLERFVRESEAAHLLTDEQILRAATESSRVNKSLQKYTMDARMGGSINENQRLLDKAKKRVKEARIVFTTCAGAGLGLLRHVDFEFDTVLIDEASQITEPCTLIPLVKGCRQAVLVGDHVQLRPTVKNMGKALEFDKSLFERLYTGPLYANMTRTMLDVQYRFSADMARFPSDEFYKGRLQTGTPREAQISAQLGPSSLPWPQVDGRLFPVVFVPCLSEEDYGRSSKSNEGQVELVRYILKLLRTAREGADADAALRQVSIAVLTPYSRQVQLLKQTIPASLDVVVSTIDGFQGREADIVVFTTVRSNAEGDIGFLEDARRLNVAWTRPRLGLVVVGNPRTLQTKPLWQRAIMACEVVEIAVPEMN
ncbi:RdRP-domain-containing protein [Obba rivulosa]|uniref:RdRP-domain-containing protein n=1 Tax=Obba rivulosa TaxID=1052685 RepID=A0A8E2AZP7_9APHY|nr:RdRP-domain-containing protein [Obba rivulosa]